ncbi:MAG: hypothetical protein RLZZ546_2558 [Bacteroidota bacterium]|jgi:cytochrome c oxidase assembly protein subunit 15
MQNRWIKIWLRIGIFMLFVQVIVGGITRLTESGLSITKWEIVSGTLPPLSYEAWQHEFELYKDTPQYNEINEGMSLSDFKFIYFWEYIHRFWARWMGFVFIIPFIFFLYKGWISTYLKNRLLLVVFLAALAASFGWIMVASGLIQRPWVNAYKLSLHLCIAFTVIAALFWTYMEYVHEKNKKIFSIFDLGSFVLLCITWVQLFLGGVMSGMKAGIYFPTWPDIGGEYLPKIIFKIGEWNYDNFNLYEQSLFLPSLIQFLHRNTAYILMLFLVYFFVKRRKFYEGRINKYILYVLISVLIQVILGIITVILCKGEVPIFMGVLHQAGALVALLSVILLRFHIKEPIN